MKLRSLILLIVMLALVNPMFYMNKDKKCKDTVIEIVFMIMFPPKAP